MKTKNFDCVEMKHLGAEKIREKIQGMTREQEAAFWKERSQALRKHQADVKQREKSDKSAA
jgi:hypothetical protein